MNSARTLETLRARRAAVALWVDAHESAPGYDEDAPSAVYTAHRDLWVRLDDAIESLELRLDRCKCETCVVFRELGTDVA